MSARARNRRKAWRVQTLTLGALHKCTQSARRWWVCTARRPAPRFGIDIWPDFVKFGPRVRTSLAYVCTDARTRDTHRVSNKCAFGCWRQSRKGGSDFLAGATVLDQLSDVQWPGRGDDSPKISLEFHESDPAARFHRSVSSIELALVVRPAIFPLIHLPLDFSSIFVLVGCNIREETTALSLSIVFGLFVFERKGGWRTQFQIIRTAFFFAFSTFVFVHY